MRRAGTSLAAQVGGQALDVQAIVGRDLLGRVQRRQHHLVGDGQRLGEVLSGTRRAGWWPSAARRRRSACPGRSGPCSAPRVSRMAVGWWAKSSTTVTPAAMPRNSCRRLTPRKRWLARAIAGERHAEAGGRGDDRRSGSRGCRRRAGRSRACRRTRALVGRCAARLRPPSVRPLTSKLQSAGKPGRA